MRTLILLAAVAAMAPQIAASGDVSMSARQIENFRAIQPHGGVKQNGLLVEGGYCRDTRYAVRPQIVRVVKIDAAGLETASETVRILGATGNRSQGCGFYVARPDWSLSSGDKIEIRPNAG